MTLEAETSTLGAAMLSERSADVAVDLLSPEHFQRDAHRVVWEAISHLRSQGKAADLASVTEVLSRTDKIEQVGGAQALFDLLSQTPAAGRVEQWCAMVRTSWRRRRLASTIERLRVEVDTTDDVDGLVEDAVAELTAGTDGPATVDKQALTEAFTTRIRSGSPATGWRMPWQELTFVRLPEDGLTVLTGLPGSGKSTWLDCLLYALDAKVAFFSPEMAPADHHLHELVRTAMGGDPRADRERAGREAQRLLRRMWWIDDDRDNSPGAVMAVARRLVRDEGVQVLVIDPYNNLEPDRGWSGDRQDLYIQALLRRLRRFARQHTVAVVVVAHPRRTEKVHGTDAVYKMPTAGDISGGQEWWNHSDVILSVWRNQSGEDPSEFGHPATVTVTASKVRFSRWGTVGKGRVRFDVESRRYTAA